MADIDRTVDDHNTFARKAEPLRKRISELERALRDLVMLERTQTPDMSGKRRTYAMMQNGKVLAECLDNARRLLGECDSQDVNNS